MILYSSFMTAKGIVSQKEKRLCFLKNSIDFFSFAKKMVAMYKMSVFDVYRAYCEENNNDFVVLLKLLLKEGCEKMFAYLDSEDDIKGEKSVLKEFFLSFGKNDTQLQIEHLDYIKEQISKIYEQETELNRNTKGMLYKTSLLIGIGISIIMW